MKHTGNLIVNSKGDAAKYAGVTEITGSVYIRAEGVSLPLLAQAGYVDIRAEGVSLPLLAQAGYVDISAEGVSLPDRKSVV